MKRIHSSYFIVAQLLFHQMSIVAANSNFTSAELTPFTPISSVSPIQPLLLAVDNSIPAYEIALAHNRLEIAKTILEQGKKHPVSIETLQTLYDAKQCMQQKNYSQALVLFNQVIDTFSKIETENKKISQQKLDTALEILKEYQDLLAISHQQIAKIYAIQGDLKEASANSIIAVLYASPPRIHFYTDYLQYLFQLKNYAAVLDFAEISLERFPQHPELLQWQTKALKQLQPAQDLSFINKNRLLVMVLGLVLFVVAIFSFINKKFIAKPESPRLKPSKKSKVKKLMISSTDLINRTEFCIKKTEKIFAVININQQGISALEKEIKAFRNLTQKISRYVETKYIEQFNKHYKNFYRAFRNYEDIKNNIEQELWDIIDKLKLLLTSLNSLKEHDQNQLFHFENNIILLEQSFDFRLRLDESLKHLSEIYHNAELSFQRINKEYQQERLKQKLQEKFVIDNAQNEDDNNNNQGRIVLTK